MAKSKRTKNSKQVTVTLGEQQIEAIQKLADKTFDGNFSMALRSHLRHTGLEDIIKHIDEKHNAQNSHAVDCAFCRIGQ